MAQVNDDDSSNAQQGTATTTDRAAEPLLKDEKVAEAHQQAEDDIARDHDFDNNPNDDLDEGEFARLGEDDADKK